MLSIGILSHLILKILLAAVVDILLVEVSFQFDDCLLFLDFGVPPHFDLVFDFLDDFELTVEDDVDVFDLVALAEYLLPSMTKDLP